MRLWSLHPKYLDQRGLVALWREALLAQAVLSGETRGYIHHPQLLRFRLSPEPCATIAAYLHGVHTEAVRRGYRFDASKIGDAAGAVSIEVHDGQLSYEGQHLRKKLTVRAPAWLSQLDSLEKPQPHPLFHVVRGGVETWEVR